MEGFPASLDSCRQWIFRVQFPGNVIWIHVHKPLGRKKHF